MNRFDRIAFLLLESLNAPKEEPPAKPANDSVPVELVAPKKKAKNSK